MKARGRRTIWLAAGITAALVAGGGAPAGAKEKFDSFAGSCSLQGTTTFSPPVTNTLQPLTTTYDGTGTCSGTLDGRQVSNTPVKMRSVGRADGSCPFARTTAPGHGSITFADGTTIRYTFEFTSVLTEVDLTMRGERSGSASAHASFLTPRTPPDVAAKCAGEGNAELPMDLSLTTDSPLVSERGCERMSQTVSSRSSCRRGAERRDYTAPRIRLAGVPRKRCARRGFRARVRIAERWSGLRLVRLSLDGRRLLVTRKEQFSRRIGACRLRPGRHRLTVIALDNAGNRSVKTARFRTCRPRAG